MTPAVRRFLPALLLFAFLGALAVPVRPGVARQATPPAAGGDAGAHTLTGPLRVTNPLLQQALSEPYVLLADLTNFVRREVNGDPPDDPQVTARLVGDPTDATYMMPLPILPRGTVSDVDGGAIGNGVQIYSVEFAANFIGDPFFDRYEAETGWGTALSSMRVQQGTYEVVGGRIVVWAADAEQGFPTDFGPDGRLFTGDDPIGPLPTGWTVIDLDASPFAQLRGGSVEIPILEGDGGLKDLSDRSYTGAFDALLAELRVRYPFREYKGIDFDAIEAEVRPLVERAERDDDELAFNLAMSRFAVLFGDGHVSTQPPIDDLLRRFGGGVGVSLGQTDDGAVLVSAVAADSPAAQAGIAPGVEIVGWDGQPVADAVADQELVFSASSPHTRTRQRLALLPRSEVGAAVTVAYRTADGGTASVDLVATSDQAGLGSVFGPAPENPAEAPVTVDVLDGGIGYVRVNTFFDDLALVAASWEWALNRLNQLRAPALIVDVRGNGGGAGQLATYFAGSFTDEPFALADNYFADETGALVYSGTTAIEPTSVRWDGPVAVLIDEECASACEIFAAALAENPDHLLVGHDPTAGVEGAVYPWSLPGDLYFQAPLGLFQRDGEVYIEGVGVAPTLDVPVTRDTLLATDDVVLDAALAALLPNAGRDR